MSDELPLPKTHYIGAPRHLQPRELELLRALLVHREGGNSVLPELEKCMVGEMDDGGMGSLFFLSEKGNRRLGRCLVEAQFMDIDNVVVSVALNLDNYDELYELDLWKVDFSKLIELPDASKIIFKIWGSTL